MGMELEKNLTALCKKRKITLAALAKKSGVKQSTLHGWATGRSVHNLDDLRKVCSVLEIGLFTLLFGEADPFESQQEMLKEVFRGNIRVTIHKFEKN